MTHIDITSTLSAFAKVEKDLGSAKKPLMEAVVRTGDHMPAANLCKILLAVGALKVDPGSACDTLLGAVLRHSQSMSAHDVWQSAVGLEWLQWSGCETPYLQMALEAVDAAKQCLLAADSCSSLAL